MGHKSSSLIKHRLDVVKIVMGRPISPELHNIVRKHVRIILKQYNRMYTQAKVRCQEIIDDRRNQILVKICRSIYDFGYMVLCHRAWYLIGYLNKKSRDFFM